VAVLAPAPDRSVIDPLLAGVETLPGVGDKLQAKLARLLDCKQPRVIDLLLNMPKRVIERRPRSSLRELEHDEHAILSVRVLKHSPPKAGTNQPYGIMVALSGNGEHIELVQWPPGRKEFAAKMPVGAFRRVAGKTMDFRGSWRLYPDHIEDVNAATAIPRIEPVYALTKGITNASLRRLIVVAIARLPDLPEWHDDAFLRERGWPSFKDALRRLHRPEAVEDVAPDGAARTRLAYDELLAHQIKLAIRGANARRRVKRPTVGDGRMVESILFDFPHVLTASQEAAVAEIIADLARPHVTIRLVQGDVGSGKTMVALLGAATVAEAGRQAALMAPTEILARQHLETIRPLADGAGMTVALLTAATPKAERADILARLAGGDLDLVIGTHALTGADVVFKDLALAMVDEQHVFGVEQRQALVKKGAAVDGLLLTATPIPRTLVLAGFSDMAVSELREKPAGRLPIDTRVVPVGRLADVEAAVGRAVADGKRAYWVCPLVEQSVKSDLAAAEARFEHLRRRFGAKVGLVHGRMKSAEREAAMARFAAGDCQILVATTVIEVGVNVPEATIIVVEHAERFGLATLHQLRGRVGRGFAQSFCLLLHDTDAGDEPARARLEILRQTNDGFRIAEEDLRLRGAGDLLGTRQSGEAGFRVADLAVHRALLDEASEHAQRIAASDPRLTGLQCSTLRDLHKLLPARSSGLNTLRGA
jgi:ATP-dependent DNA helicase RecG